MSNTTNHHNRPICSQLWLVLSQNSVLGPARPQIRWIALLIALVATTPLSAQTKSSAVGDGLSVTIEWLPSGSAGGGYCPLHVQISNTTARERPLRVVLDSQMGPQGQNEVQQSLELPASGKADFVMSMPLTSPYEYGILKIYERGSELKKLRIPGVGGNYWWYQSPIPTVAIIGNSAPDMRNLSAAITQVTLGQSAANAANYAPMMVKGSEAPTKWIDYTMLDMVVVSLKELEQLPGPARDAILTWTSAGGNLFVYGVDDRENSAELKRLTDFERRPPQGAEWRRPRGEDRNAEFAGNNQIVSSPGGQIVAKRSKQPLTKSASADSKESAAASKGETNFSVRDFGLGQLGAGSMPDPFPGTLEEWGWLLKTFKTNRVQWQERHGIAARFENDDFWDFLIPGVGRAPVGGFQLLITLFAVVIGPINYFLLRRRGQLYFIIATVPVLALFTTLMLLGYAVVSDGFALRARVRSVTQLDQVRGESVSWSRVSYYAGVAPSGGLKFSNDTAVYPIRSPGSPVPNRVLDWTVGQQMPSGWLRSRTPTQLLTVHSGQATEHLAIASSSTGAARVSNHLGTKVELLIVADEDGRILTAQDIEPDDSQRLEPEAIEDLHIALRTAIERQPLETPVEITNRNSGMGFFGTRVRFWGPRLSVQWNSGRLEELLQMMKGPDSAAFRNLLRPRTYIAVTGQPPMVDIGVPDHQDEGSLFVVIGTY